MSTVYETFANSCAQFTARPFLHIPAVATRHYHDTAIDLSYAEAWQQVGDCAKLYAAKGYGLGHRVALLLENRAEYFIHWLALNSLGCSLVPINGEMPAEEIAYLLSHSESVVVVSVSEKIALLEQANALLEHQLPVIDVTAMAQLPRAPSPAVTGTANAATECALLYTSGSTGKPKGCILSNEYFVEFGRWYAELGGLCALTPGQERLLTPLPMVHMNAMAVSTMGMICTGGCVIQLDRFHPSSWWQTVRESGATVIHYLGVLPAILLNLPEADDDFSQQIKFGFGAGVNPKHHAVFEKRFGFPLIEAWAMTECGSGGTVIANQEPRHIGTCCFGKASAAVAYRLVDEQNNDVPKGEDGELLVRTAGDKPWKGFFSGYLKNPQATEEALEGGWLHTGDVVREGDDGSLYFVDRRKNVIRRSGENISALEVEAAMAEIPQIDQAVVTAVPDELRGDEVMALIVLHRGIEGNPDVAEQIVRQALQNLVYYKVPGFVAFCDQLPLTASQKPKRADIKILARQRLAAASCFDTRHLKKRSH